jgi:fimbrial isopeptide formation D2 family protein
VVKNMRGRIAVLVTAALALVATPLAASAAAAEPASIPTITQTEGRLHIVKLAQPGTQGSEAPGTEIPGKTGGIDGVTFEAQRLTEVDLTTAEGWQTAQNLTPEAARAKALASPVTGTTKDGGRLTLTLPVGLYLVQETKTPADVVPAVPFLVTIPMTNPTNPAEWMYDIYVYPKSADAKLTKTISDSKAVVAGDTFTYDVKMAIPTGTTELVLRDTLDGMLAFEPGKDSLWLLGDKLGEVAFDPDVLPSGVSVSFAERTLTVTFAGSVVSENESLGFRIASSVSEPGVVSNKASYTAIVPGGSVSGESNPVDTKWGRIDVLKTDESGNPLGDAVFRIALSKEDAEAGKFVRGEAQSDAVTGKLSFVVRYSDWWDGKAHTTDTRQYWLVETKAPANYELQPKPIGPFYVTEAPDDAAEATVVNVRHNAGFDLPLIGGNRAILPILAAIVVGGGVIWLVRSRRANG